MRGLVFINGLQVLVDDDGFAVILNTNKNGAVNFSIMFPFSGDLTGRIKDQSIMGEFNPTSEIQKFFDSYKQETRLKNAGLVLPH